MKKYTLVLTAFLVLTACSHYATDPRYANEGYDYLKKSEIYENTPNTLPASSISQYTIPQINNSSPIGENLSITPPTSTGNKLKATQ